MVVLKLKMASASKRRRTTFLSENEIRRLLENDNVVRFFFFVLFCYFRFYFRFFFSFSFFSFLNTNHETI